MFSTLQSQLSILLLIAASAPLQIFHAVHVAILAQAFQIPLPGGRSINFNEKTGVLRINLEAERDRKGPTTGVPPLGTVPSDDVLKCIQVRDTGTPKGYGAFATPLGGQSTNAVVVVLPSESFLGFYQGDIITTREELDATVQQRRKKLLSGNADTIMDYVMSLDGGVTFLDGYARAQDRSSFSPVHLNHADRGTNECNVMRLLEDDRVAFFTSRDILAGEELCFDYGSNFWKGREDVKL